MKFLVGKPGLDGHSNGAEQIAVRARDAGMEVVYDGIRLTAEEIVAAARGEERARGRPLDPLRLAPAAGERRDRRGMKEAGLDVPVVVGGIIPPEDASALKDAGVAAVYTPKDFEINRDHEPTWCGSSKARRTPRSSSAQFGMAGLVPAIHNFVACSRKKDVDARLRAGHDDVAADAAEQLAVVIGSPRSGESGSP